jgi:hypothetical protein
MDGLRFGINLDAKGIFNEKCLIYTIRDEHGSPTLASQFEEGARLDAKIRDNLANLGYPLMKGDLP